MTRARNKDQREVRFMSYYGAESNFEVRAENGQSVVEGHAAVWNKLSQNLGGFVEQCNVGAFAKTIQEADVRALKNHDPNYVLGRNTAHTLDLSEDSTGLLYRVMMPNTTYAHDLMESMQRGDVTNSSFAFRAIDEEWGFTDQEFPLRTLLQCQLYDVSVVTYPAYLDADSGIAQNALRHLAEERGMAVDELVNATDLGALIRNKRAVGDSMNDTMRALGDALCVKFSSDDLYVTDAGPDWVVFRVYDDDDGDEISLGEGTFRLTYEVQNGTVVLGDMPERVVAETTYTTLNTDVVRSIDATPSELNVEPVDNHSTEDETSVGETARSQALRKFLRHEAERRLAS